MSPHRGAAVVFALGTALLAACGGGSGAAEPCDAPVEEPLDAGVLLHVLPEVDVEYASNPPTSGPHVGAAPEGVLDAPLAGPVQVAVLERGDVLVQYGPTVDEADLTFLVEGVDDRVVVAPNPDLPAPIVVTAWRWKLTCRQLDLDALDRFVADRAGAVSGH